MRQQLLVLKFYLKRFVEDKFLLLRLLGEERHAAGSVWSVQDLEVRQILHAQHVNKLSQHLEDENKISLVSIWKKMRIKKLSQHLMDESERIK